MSSITPNPSSTLLKTLYNNHRSGTIRISVPRSDGTDTVDFIEALLLNDIKLELKNNWKTLLPQGQSLSAASQVFTAFENVASWVGLSQVVWTGSEPLTIPVEFMLVSYNEDSKITDRVKSIFTLACPTNATSGIGAIIHGGYKPDYLSLDGNTTEDLLKNYTPKDGTSQNSEYRGTVTLEIGNKLMVTDLLLEDMEYNPSTVEVADGNPLYIKVKASFRTYRTMYANEIVNMINIA